MSQTKRITAGEIRQAMTKKWAAPEWAIMWEVANATGFSDKRRYADAVMMSLWPSRGLELHGVEIKISRSDWKREAADPQKAEEIARFCDRWWVHTPPGVVDDISGMPPAWGLREWNGKQWRTLKEAERTEAAPPSREFLAALLRRADGALRTLAAEAVTEATAALAQERQDLHERHEQRVEKAVLARTKQLQSVANRIAEFEKAFGGSFFDAFGVDHIKLGRAARVLAEAQSGWGSIAEIEQRLRRAADELAAINCFVGEGENT